MMRQAIMMQNQLLRAAENRGILSQYGTWAWEQVAVGLTDAKRIVRRVAWPVQDVLESELRVR